MSRVVKRGRPGGYRQEQAAATKERILGAARGLFAERGYTDTTMEAIAVSAGVAPRTVYSSFGSKREILEAIRRAASEEATADDVDEILQEPDALKRLDLAAGWLRKRNERSADLVAVYRAAAATEPQLANEWRRLLQERRRDSERIAASLGGVLASPAEPATAAATVHALASTEVYQELVGEARWPAERYERWLAAALRRLLLI